MRVVIGGASGLIGSALVPVLEADGHDVLRLVRREPREPGEIRWDPAAGVLDAAPLAGVDGIVNLSGESIGRRWTASRRREILDSRTHATGLLARTAAALDPKPTVLVSASAIGVYPDRGDEVLTEDSEEGAGFEPDVVRAWEAAAQPARDAGIRVVTFRQSPILAREGGMLDRLRLPFKLGLGGRLGSGRQWFSWVSLDDVTSAYALALSADLEGIYNLTSPNPVTNAQFTRALGKVLHRPAVIPVPGFAIRTLFGEMGDEMVLAGKRILPGRLLEHGFEFSAPTIDVALARVFDD